MTPFVVIPLKPRFTPLPEFNIAETPKKYQRIKQYLDAGKNYQTAIRATDREFKAAAAPKAAELKATFNEIQAVRG